MKFSFFSALIFFFLWPSLAFAGPPRPRLSIEVRDLSGSQSIPRGAMRVSMLEISLRASCDASASVQSITVTRSGRGKADGILRVYALEGNERLTRGVHIGASDDSAYLRLDRWMVLACDERTITIVADFSPDAEIASEHRFELRRLRDIETDAVLETASASDPESTSAIVPDVFGSISVTYGTLSRAPRYGSREIVSRLSLAADAVDDHFVSAITFTNDGTASNADLRNIYLESASHNRLSNPVAKLRGDHVRVVIDPPLRLARNDTIRLVLRADVRASRKRTIRFIIEEPSDIEAKTDRGR